MNLSEVPSTIFVAAGAILAAAVTGAVSFVNLIISKDQKVSEFRQEWINRLRDDIAKYLAHINTVCLLWQATTLSKGETRLDGDELKDFVNSIQNDIRLSRMAYTRIILRLNPVEHKPLIEKLEAVENVLDSPDILCDIEQMTALFNAASDTAHIYLRKEWKRVKRGEPSFFITKYAALIIFIAIFITSIYYGQKFMRSENTVPCSNKSQERTE